MQLDSNDDNDQFAEVMCYTVCPFRGKKSPELIVDYEVFIDSSESVSSFDNLARHNPLRYSDQLLLSTFRVASYLGSVFQIDGLKLEYMVKRLAFCDEAEWKTIEWPSSTFYDECRTFFFRPSVVGRAWRRRSSSSSSDLDFHFEVLNTRLNGFRSMTWTDVIYGLWDYASVLGVAPCNIEAACISGKP
jgi:hypothetical protein